MLGSRRQCTVARDPAGIVPAPGNRLQGNGCRFYYERDAVIAGHRRKGTVPMDLGSVLDETRVSKSIYAHLGEADGASLICNLDTGLYFLVDESALSVWAAIDGSTFSSLVERVARDAGSPADEVAHALRGFVSELAKNGLVTLDDATP